MGEQGRLFEPEHATKHTRLLRPRTKLEDYRAKVADILRLYEPGERGDYYYKGSRGGQISTAFHRKTGRADSRMQK